MNFTHLINEQDRRGQPSGKCFYWPLKTFYVLVTMPILAFTFPCAWVSQKSSLWLAAWLGTECSVLICCVGVWLRNCLQSRRQAAANSEPSIVTFVKCHGVTALCRHRHHRHYDWRCFGFYRLTRISLWSGFDGKKTWRIRNLNIVVDYDYTQLCCMCAI